MTLHEKKPSPLEAVQALRASALDAARPAAVSKRHNLGRRTVRENLDDLLDPQSFVEYGRATRPVLPDMEGAADGMVMGTGRINDLPVAVACYDYTVHAGTQSFHNHMKTGRMFELAMLHRWPLVCWLEGGGARPHDLTIGLRASITDFGTYARLSGLVPIVGIVTGNAFAGHANLAGGTDCLIATRNAAMGMAGPPLVEAALGHKYTPREIGDAEVHFKTGVIDLLCDTDAEAVALAKKYLGFFTGPQQPGEAPDTERLRTIVPENPRRAYDVRKVIEHFADCGSALELKAGYGKACVTALTRVAGYPLGVIANQPMQIGGAIDSAASEKMARFIELCDAFDIPFIFLVDTPGLMVGPEIETTGLMRRSARILTALGQATVPFMTLVLRKAYGLGYYIMGSEPLKPALLLAWPTAEFGGMGLEGAVNIIHKKDLEAETDPERRAALHAEKTSQLRAFNTGINVAGRFEVDDIIDPAETRDMLANTLRALPRPLPRAQRKHPVSPM